MPFRFVYLCDLLDDLEKPYIRDAPMLPKPLREYKSKTFTLWLQKHRDRLNDFSTNDLAVMSMLQPEKWVDRDFGMDIESVERMLARVLRLNRAQVDEVRRHRTEPYNGDLGAFVERVVVSMEKMVLNVDALSVTIEEIDQAFLRIASHNPGSSPEVQALATACPNVDVMDEFSRLFNRLHPREVKWLTRLILKTIEPAKFPTDYNLASNQSQFPNFVKLNVEFPTSSPVALQLGGTGVRKGTSSVHGFSTLRMTASRISLGPPARKYGPEQRITKDMKSLRSDVTKLNFANNMSQKPTEKIVESVQVSIKLTAHPRPQNSPQRPLKRRRVSRDRSPGPLVFQRGILQPIRAIDISNNLSQSSSSFAKSSNEANNSQIVRRQSSDSQASSYVPTFKMGDFPSDRTRKTVCRASTNPAMDPQPPNARLEAPRSTSKSQRQGGDPHENHPRNRQLSKSMSATVSPPRQFTRSQSPSESPISSKESTPHLPATPVVEELPTTPATLPPPALSPSHQVSAPSCISTPIPAPLPKPAICLGTGICATSAPGTPCLLDNYIFLLGPHIPNPNRLLTTLLPSHTSLYLSTPSQLSQLSHPPLPYCSPVTNKKYCKVILIETHPDFVKSTCDFLRSVQAMDLQQKGKNGEMEKEWICAYDWRLVESAGRAEENGRMGDDREGGKGYWQGSRWRKYFMCVV